MSATSFRPIRGFDQPDPRDHDVVDPHPEPDAECVCAKCGEPQYFVTGIRGHERWKHVRTGESRCLPLCKVCGDTGTVRITSSLNVLCHWLCRIHADKALYIERT